MEVRNGQEKEGGCQLKRSFHGNYQAGHVQKAKLQKTDTHIHLGPGPWVGVLSE